MKRGQPDTSPAHSPKRRNDRGSRSGLDRNDPDLRPQDTSGNESRYGSSGRRDQLPIEKASDTHKHTSRQGDLYRLATMNPVEDGRGGLSDSSRQPRSRTRSGERRRSRVPDRQRTAQAERQPCHPAASFFRAGAKQEPDTFEAGPFMTQLLKWDAEESISDFMDENGSFVCAVCRRDNERIWYCAVCWRRFHAGCHVPKLSNNKHNTWTCTLCDYKSELIGPPERLSAFKPIEQVGALSDAELKVCHFVLLQLLCHRSRLSFKHPLPEMAELFNDLSNIEQKLVKGQQSSFKSLFQFIDSIRNSLEQAIETYDSDPKQKLCAEMLGQYFLRLASVMTLLLGRAARMKIYEGPSTLPTERRSL